ncbi:MAG TPA: hypothetical protein VHL59_00660, partial [Thermoanaerobaculia bacterium]|nr:hypothetical protein [Thermoanaerobaculia bacterium]
MLILLSRLCLPVLTVLAHLADGFVASALPPVSIRVAAANEHGISADAALRIDAQLMIPTGGFGPPVQYTCALRVPCELRLPAAGTWTFSSGDPAYYIPPKSEAVHTNGAQPAMVTLVVYRTAAVVGDYGGAPPSKMSVTFQTPGSSFGSESHCEVEQRRWRCSVPAGVWDLKFRAPGRVSQYRWNVPVRTEGQNHLGRITLSAGASVVGRVELEKDLAFKRGEAVRVVLAPAGAPLPDGGQRRQARLDAVVNERGFFQFEGVPAGAYR